MSKHESAGRCIRRYCRDVCCNGQCKEVELCPSGDPADAAAPCPLYPRRLGTGPTARSLAGWAGGTPRTSIKAIRARCLDCAPEPPFDARRGNCGVPQCPLYPYRLGKNPNRAGQGAGTTPPFHRKSSQMPSGLPVIDGG